MDMWHDQKFNIHFVSLVEAHPCLYDHTRSDYHLTHVQDKAWLKVARVIGHGATIADCKTRWKNLRGSYTRHLKKYGSGVSIKSPYYLAEYMHFILPFTRQRKARSNIDATVKEEAPDIFENSIEESDTQDSEKSTNYKEEEASEMNESDEDPFIKEIHDTSQDFLMGDQQDFLEETDLATTQKRTLESGYLRKRAMVMPSVSLSETKIKRNKAISNHVSSDEAVIPQRIADTSINDDADAHFLLSLLPDLKKMTDSQKRKFKVGILNLAGGILDEDTLNIPSTSSNV